MPRRLPPFLLMLGAFAATSPTQAVEVVGGVTSLRLDPNALANLGIAVESQSSATGLRPGAVGFRVLRGSRVSLAAPGGDLEGLDDVALRHAGSFALRIGDDDALRFPALRIEAASDELVLVDAGGTAQLAIASMHLKGAPASLRIEHADVLITPALAARLGRPDLARAYLGVLDARLDLAPPSEGAGEAALLGSSCVAYIGPPVDLELYALDLLSQGAREAGGRVAMAPRAFVRNLGPGDVAWGHAIAPDAPVGPHPYLALSFYRLGSDGFLEQIGRADAKHAFFSINTGCPCDADNVMYAGCQDVYGISTNLDRRYLAPRDEIDVFARTWTSAFSHFDGPDGDDVRDHFEADHDAFEHRLVVQEPDLETPGARYFIEAWYLAPDDLQLANSLGHREVAPALSDSTWTFPVVGDLANGPILDRVVDPDAPPPGSDNRLVDTGEGRVQLAVQTEDLGGGVTRYVYTLMNFDFERRIERLSVPLLGGQTVSAAGFADGDGEAANDWDVTVSSGGVTWDAPLGGELDWGALVGFTLEVDAAPVATQVSLVPADPGAFSTQRVLSLGPAIAVAEVPSWGRGATALAIAAFVAIAARARRRR